MCPESSEAFVLIKSESHSPVLTYCCTMASVGNFIFIFNNSVWLYVKVSRSPLLFLNISNKYHVRVKCRSAQINCCRAVIWEGKRHELYCLTWLPVCWKQEESWWESKKFYPSPHISFLTLIPFAKKTKDKKHLRNAFTSVVPAYVPMLPSYLKTNRTVLS